MKTVTRYFFIFTIILPLISCAAESKSEKKDEAVTAGEHFQLAYNAVEKGIFTQEEFLEMVRMVVREMKRKESGDEQKERLR